jgi:hypothetical protein
MREAGYSHGVGSPEKESVAGDGHEEGAELGALCGSIGASVQGKVPDDEDVGNAGNGVPAPLLGSTLLAKGGEQTLTKLVLVSRTRGTVRTGENHDQIGNDGHDDVSTRHASEETEIEEQQRSGQAPVDVTSPVDLAVDLGECVWDVVVLVADRGGLDRDTMSGSHGEVRQGSEDGDGSGDGVV